MLPRVPPWLPAAAVALLAAAAFVPALGGEFVNWDDDWNFVTNPNYRGLGPAHLKWMFTDSYGHYMPVTWLTLGLDYALYGMNPRGYHLTSILFHAAAALVFYFIVLRLLRKALPGTAETTVRWCAFAGALFFAVHPLRAESVAWVTERRDVVSGLFFMLALLAYLKSVDADPRRKLWLAASAGCFAVSLLSKAMGMMLPAVLLAIDVYPLRRLDLARPSRSVIVEKIPHAVLLLASIVATRVFQDQAGALFSAAQYPMADRLLQPAYKISFYVWKTFLPIGLSPLYPYRSVSFGLEPKYFIGLAAVLVSAALLWKFRRRRPELVAAAFCYLALISPAVVWQAGPHVAADRYSYLACLPFAVLAGGWIAGRGKAVAAGAAAAILVLSVLCWRQASIWSDSVSLWTRAIDLGTASPMPYVSRGAARAEKGDLDGAVADFQAALRIDPREKKANDNLSKAALLKGDAAAAETYATAAIERDPDFAHAWFNRGLARAERRQFDAADQDFTRAMELALKEQKPSLKPVDALTNRAVARQKAGKLAEAEGDATQAIAMDRAATRPVLIRAAIRTIQRRYDDALEDYALARTLDPKQPSPRVSRGFARAEVGDLDGALADYTEAIRLDGNDVQAFLLRGLARTGRNDSAGAIADYSEAIRINPKLALGWTRRGRAKAKKGDLDGAIADTTQALAIDPNDAEALSVRGCARGDKGDLQGAAEDLERALRVAPPNWGERPSMQALLDQARRMMKR